MIFLVSFPKIKSELFLPALFVCDLIIAMKPMKGMTLKEIYPPKSIFPPSGRVKFANSPPQLSKNATYDSPQQTGEKETVQSS